VIKNIIATVLLLVSFPAFSQTAGETHLSKAIYENASLPFESHRGKNPFDTALAMNVQYSPVEELRNQLSDAIHFNLKFFKGWNENGEAHVTVITPPEYDNIISRYVSIDEIEKIALKDSIQTSDLKIIGIGKGSAVLNGKNEDAYFIIVQSKNLLKIRQDIYQAYLRNGGPADAWDPKHFYSHITIGFTVRDLHEADSVIKDEKSLDNRFKLEID
jgi:hypothetical protein